MLDVMCLHPGDGNYRSAVLSQGIEDYICFDSNPVLPDRRHKTEEIEEKKNRDVRPD
jgi:hypothetical protein